jgi:hypothetical protein
MAAIQWHHLFFTLTNSLSFHNRSLDRFPDRLHDHAQWVSETNLHTVETWPSTSAWNSTTSTYPSRRGHRWPAHEHLSHSLRSIRVDDAYAASGAHRFPPRTTPQRYDQIGAEVMDSSGRRRCADRYKSADWDDREPNSRRSSSPTTAPDVQLVQLFNHRWLATRRCGSARLGDGRPSCDATPGRYSSADNGQMVLTFDRHGTA